MGRNTKEYAKLERELTTLRREKAKLAKIRQAKLELLQHKVEMYPERFKANHPVLTFLAEHGMSGAKYGAKGLAKIAKETGKAALGGFKEFAIYAAEKKAQQYEREGDWEKAWVIRNRLKRIKA